MTGRRQAIVTCIALAIARVAAAQTAPVMAVSPTTVDAGKILVLDKTATTMIHVANAGGGTLKLLDVQIVDGGTGAAADWTLTAGAPCGVTIPPECDITADAPVDLRVVFDPSAIAVRDATLLIHYTDTADRSIAIPLHGVGDGATLDLVGGPRTLDFGTVPTTSAAGASLDVELTNRGSRDLTDGEIDLTGAAFTASHGPPAGVAFTVPTTDVQPAQTITVTCHPPGEGAFTGSLVLSSLSSPSPPITIPLQCTGSRTLAVTATPPAIQLGEVRVGSGSTSQVEIAVTGAPVTLSAAFNATFPPLPLSVTGAPAAPATAATLEITAAPTGDGGLTGQLVVTAGNGSALSLAVTGSAVTAAYSVPAAISLGTFCTQQPATPRILQLASTGTATIGLTAPTLAGGTTAYDLQVVAPLIYPTTLPPEGRATVAVTPRLRDTAGLATDQLTWATDVAGLETAPTQLTATFVDNGGAIAPESLAFAPTPIHLDTPNAQEVTLQNCDVSPLQLDPPQVPVPFTIDSPSFPTMLLPGEIVSFSVGFHPTKVGSSMKTLVITSPQLTGTQLSVRLTGDGYAQGATIDAGEVAPVDQPAAPTSFYACSGCSTNDPASALAFGVAVVCTLIPRRRRPAR